MSEPASSRTYTAEQAAEIFDAPIAPVLERLREQHAEQRPAIERAIRALGHEPVEC